MKAPVQSLPRAFRPVYRYKFKNGQVHSEKPLDDKLWKQRGVVYARVCNDQVVYVGKTDGTLRGRILQHIRMFPTAPKGMPYRKHVEGKIVTIFAYKPKPIRLFGLEIPVHGSVETALIKKYKSGHPFFGKRSG
jgi:hypothetical protein